MYLTTIYCDTPEYTFKYEIWPFKNIGAHDIIKSFAVEPWYPKIIEFADKLHSNVIHLFISDSETGPQ